MSDDKPTCENCGYMSMEHHGGYCYMFRNRPDILDKWGGFCAQHTSIAKLSGEAARIALMLILDDVQEGKKV